MERSKEMVFLQKGILFLCTGNSCRSQMAEGFAEKSIKIYRTHIIQRDIRRIKNPLDFRSRRKEV